MIKAHGKWQLFVVCIYSGIKIGPTFSLGQAYRSGSSILALFISTLPRVDQQTEKSISPNRLKRERKENILWLSAKQDGKQNIRE